MNWVPRQLLRLGEARGYLSLVRFALIPLEDVVLPPFTSTVMKAIMLRAECMEQLAWLYRLREASRPITVRVLKTQDGRPLYTVTGSRGELAVRRGEKLIGEVGFHVLPESTPIFPESECLGETVRLGGAAFRVFTLEADTAEVSSLGLSPPERIVVELVTPTAIPIKLLASSLSRRLVNSAKAYRLLPTPGYILGEAARQMALTVMGSTPEEAARAGRRVALLMDPLVAEVDFNLRPVTAVYARRKRVRGVVGRLVLEPLSARIAPQVWGLLRLASFLGLGKSRALGFGEVKVSRSRGRISGGVKRGGLDAG